MDVYVLATVITSARLDAEFSRILTFILLFAEPRRRRAFGNYRRREAESMKEIIIYFSYKPAHKGVKYEEDN